MGNFKQWEHSRVQNQKDKAWRHLLSGKGEMIGRVSPSSLQMPKEKITPTPGVITSWEKSKLGQPSNELGKVEGTQDTTDSDAIVEIARDVKDIKKFLEGKGLIDAIVDALKDLGVEDYNL